MKKVIYILVTLLLLSNFVFAEDDDVVGPRVYNPDTSSYNYTQSE